MTNQVITLVQLDGGAWPWDSMAGFSHDQVETL
jgi:hypothetical protein